MTPLTNRRQFLAVASLGLCTADAVAGDKRPATMQILDTHQHIWDLSKFDLPWLKNEPALGRSFLLEDYREATQGLNVVKSIYMEVDVRPDQQTKEAEYVLDICKKGQSTMAAAVISGRPASDGFANSINRFKGNKYIKGVRQVLHGPSTPAGYCLDPKFIRGIRHLGDIGMSFDVCLRPDELPDGAKLIEACPDTRFILDHCGNGMVGDKDRTKWQRGMEAVAKHRNVVGKVSGIVASAKPGKWGPDDLAPLIHHTVEVFGHDRVMFGGDWPVCTLGATYRQWVEALKTVVKDWTEEDQRKLFYSNAAKVYGV